jgi:hypothetical protein
MEKQTAVQWYFEKQTELDNSFDEQEIDILEYIERKKEIQDQAYQMEKEQIVNAYWDGGQDVPMHISTCENYYNETFGVETGVIVFDNIHLTNTNKINNGGNNE